MTAALITVALLALINGIAWIVSRRIDRSGLPPALHDRFIERKPDTLPPRGRRIAINLATMSIGVLIGFPLLGDLIGLAWPGLGALALQILVVAVIDDFCFYWAHRWMHRIPRLYRSVHKIHHEAYAPVPIEYIYVHPIEHAMGAVGTALGFALVIALWGHLSAWTVWAYLVVRTGHELEIHSGAWLPTHHIPLLAPPRHHDVHHARPTKGNYASIFLIWDRLLGTRIPDDRPPMASGQRAERR